VIIMRINDIDKLPSNPKGVAMFLAIYGCEELTIQVRENLMVLIPAGPDTWSVEFNGEYLGEQGVDQVANGLVQFKRQVTAANRYRAFQSATNQPTWQQSAPPQQGYPRLPLQPQSGYSLPRHATTPEPDIIDIGSRLIGSVFGGIRRGLY
jgi:hypothetical protein